MGAAATTTSKTTTTRKPKAAKAKKAATTRRGPGKAKKPPATSSTSTAAGKALADMTAAQRKKLATAVMKDPTSVDRDTRSELVALGLAAQGLKGKALTLWIEQGETPTETVKRSPATKKSAAATDTDPTPIESGGSVVYDRAVDMLKMLKQAKQPVTIVDMKAKLGGQHPQYLSMLAALEATGTVKKYRVSGGKVAFTLA